MRFINFTITMIIFGIVQASSCRKRLCFDEQIDSEIIEEFSRREQKEALNETKKLIEKSLKSCFLKNLDKKNFDSFLTSFYGTSIESRFSMLKIFAVSKIIEINVLFRNEFYQVFSNDMMIFLESLDVMENDLILETLQEIITSLFELILDGFIAQLIVLAENVYIFKLKHIKLLNELVFSTNRSHEILFSLQEIILADGIIYFESIKKNYKLLKLELDYVKNYIINSIRAIELYDTDFNFKQYLIDLVKNFILFAEEKQKNNIKLKKHNNVSGRQRNLLEPLDLSLKRDFLEKYLSIKRLKSINLRGK